MAKGIVARKVESPCWSWQSGDPRGRLGLEAGWGGGEGAVEVGGGVVKLSLIHI